MMKIIILNSCADCPYLRIGKEWRCELNCKIGTHLYKVIPDHDKFPEFCTLQDLHPDQE
jgi:hypothetical protein